MTQNMTLPQNLGLDDHRSVENDISKLTKHSQPFNDYSMATLTRNRADADAAQEKTRPFTDHAIWGGGIRQPAASNPTTRDVSRARESSQQRTSTAKGGVIGQKSGSSLLIDSSVSETPWAHNRGASSGRTYHQTSLFPNETHQIGRSTNDAGLTYGLNNTFASSSAFPPTDPTSTLQSTTSNQLRSQQHVNSFAGLSGMGNVTPPFNVYPKHKHTKDGLSNGSDSAVGFWSDSMTPRTPSEERQAQYITQPNNRSSLPTSRDGSLPPSRHFEETQGLGFPAFLGNAQRHMPQSSRDQTSSSIFNGTLSGHAGGNGDSIVPQIGNLSINDARRNGPTPRFSRGANQNPMNPIGHAANPSASSSASRQSLSPYKSGFDDSPESQQIGGAWGDDLPSKRYSQKSTLNPTARPRPMPPPFTFREFHPGDSFRESNSSHYQLPYRQDNAWPIDGHTPFQISRRGPRSPQQQQSMVDPRLQPLLAAQLRTPYAALYNQAFQNALQLNAMWPYMSLAPSMPDMESAQPLVQDSTFGQSVQSPLLCQFRATMKTKRYELRDIYDHVVEFSGDQHGSRFIQTKLETANSEERERVFRELQSNLIPLMTDVFGNYVIQKFFEHGDQTQKKILANAMKGKVVTLSYQPYGCRVVQKALDHVLVDQQASLVNELQNSVVELVKDQNGNHVIQKAIEQCPSQMIEFIVTSMRGRVHQLSIHSYGCRVVQRCLEKPDLPIKSLILSELIDCVQTMIPDQYGNYVVQHIVTHDDGPCKQAVLLHVSNHAEVLSRHKYASNVVEKCIQNSDDAYRRNLVRALDNSNKQRPENEVLVGLVKDQYGNYVIRKSPSSLLPFADSNSVNRKAA